MSYTSIMYPHLPYEITWKLLHDHEHYSYSIYIFPYGKIIVKLYEIKKTNEGYFLFARLLLYDDHSVNIKN